MTERRKSTKLELMADIAESWARLNAFLSRLTPDQLTTLHDTEGWAVKDHVIHLTHWERSVIYFLRHTPRYQGLGVAEKLYLEGSEDDINAAIHEQTHNLPLAEALSQFREAHQQLLALLEPLTNADLQKRYHEYLPDEPGAGGGPLAFDVIYSNTADHFAAHLGWIETLVSQAGAEV